MIEYILVRCYSDPCGMFQVIQKTKSNKWGCKICQEKQSLKQIYGTSYKAKDLRELCQQRNMDRGMRDEANLVEKKRRLESMPEDDIGNFIEDEFKPATQQPPKKNRWAIYEDQKEPEENETGDHDPRFVLNPPEVKRGRGNASKPRNTMGRTTNSRAKVASKPVQDDDYYDDDDTKSFLEKESPIEQFRYVPPVTTNTNKFAHKSHSPPTLSNSNPILKSTTSNSARATTNASTNNKGILNNTTTHNQVNTKKPSKWSQYEDDTEKDGGSDSEEDGFVLGGNDGYVVVDEERFD